MNKREFTFLDRPEVLRVLYHPRQETCSPQLNAMVHRIHIDVDNHVALGGTIYDAGPDTPVILFFHGNGEIASDYDTVGPAYTNMGITLFVVDYRGYGISNGTPTAANQLADAITVYNKAFDILRDHGANAPPLFVMGRSMGSASALEIARHAGDSIKGLIIESGFAFTFPLIERLGRIKFPDADESNDGFGNLDKMSRITVPTLLIHGQEDRVIPVTDGRIMLEKCAATDKRMIEIAQAGHNDLMIVDQQEYFGAIRDLVARHIQ